MSNSTKIAVIDDEVSVLESLKLILNIKDYEIATYEKAVNFLEIFKKDGFNIVLLDLWLQKDPLPYGRPEMDGGLEVLKKIKELSPNTEVIIITGTSNEVAHARAIELGALDYLKKPFMMQDVYDLIDRGLRRQAKTSAHPTNEGGPSLTGIH
ncbi:MAG: response regulator [Candidatus Margulisiibacteriota bacterium]